MAAKRLCPLGKVVALDQQWVPNLLARSLRKDLPEQISGNASVPVARSTRSEEAGLDDSIEVGFAWHRAIDQLTS